MQHSFYALTGCPEILNYQDEGSPYRFLLRAYDAGYLVWPVYSNRFDVDQDNKPVTTTQNFWRSMKYQCRAESDVRLLVTIQPKAIQHVFAIQANFSNGELLIADPGANRLLPIKFEEFLLHPDYPKALDVLCVDSGKIEDHASIPPS